MKQCPNCSAFAEDESKFCVQCGSRFQPQVNPQPSFSQPQAPQGVQGNYVQQPQSPNNFNTQPQNSGSFSAPTQGNYSQPQMPNNFNAQPQNVGGFNTQPQYQAPMAPQMPKKKGIKAWQIILIVIGGLIGLFVIIGVIGAIADSGNDYYDDGYDYYDSDYDYDYDDEYYDADFDSDAVSYTKGSIIDGWYVNEWANIKFEVTDDWYEGNTSEYDDAYAECGLVLHNINNSNVLAIMFVDLSSYDGVIDVDEYLDGVADGAKEEVTNAGLTCDISDIYNVTIAGETYRALKLTLNNGLAVQQLCAREQDGHIVFINITADDSFDANSTLNNIRTVD